MADDMRAVLEGIAYGTDPKITTADRLKAIAELRTMPTRQDTELHQLADEINVMSDQQLAKELEGFAVPAPKRRKPRRRKHLRRKPRSRPEPRSQDAHGDEPVASPDPPTPDEPAPPSSPQLPPDFSHVDDPELRRRMLMAAQRGENPFDVPGAV
jgi:hypothetical protein